MRGLGSTIASEYVVDMIDDTWTLTKKGMLVPIAFPNNGGFAPEDMRPDTGKKQFIDLTTMNPFTLKLGMRQDDSQVSATGVVHGRYTVATTWMNVRAGSEIDSVLLAKGTNRNNLHCGGAATCDVA